VANPRLALIILAVRDLASMTAFYRDVLGWRQLVDGPVYVELGSDDGLRLGLYVDASFGNNIGVVPPASPGLTRTELYLHCADLEGALRRAADAGARPLSPLAPRDWGDEAANFADPEGNVVVFARPIPGSG